MPSVWVKWAISSFDYTEITINDVVGEVARASGMASCEGRGDLHGDGTYIVHTRKGPFVLCRRCCKTLGLRLPPVRKFGGKR